MKIIIFGLIITGLYGFLYAGKIIEMQGKVDLLLDGKWQPAAVDMGIQDNTKIMTGIGSSMKVETKGGFFTVNELSMVTFKEKTTETSSDQQLSVDIGKVSVHFTKIQGIKSSFKVQSPKGTASVRGTWEDFSFGPARGMKVDVIEGSIDIADNSGSHFTASQGEQGGVKGNGQTFSQTGIVQQNVGTTEQFSDNDTHNNVIQNVIQQNIPSNIVPKIPETPKVSEPERL